MIDHDGRLSGLEANDDSSITLVACGDLALVRRVEEKLLESGPMPLWEDGLDLFQKADIAVANLECPVSDRGEPFKSYPPNFRADPRTLCFLTESGIDVVSLANNHILDHGPEAVIDTIERLSRNGIGFFGAGKDQESAQEPLIIERAGIKVGFLGFNEWGPFGDNGSPGPSRYSEKNVLEGIDQLKSHVDLVIVSVHFGFEFVDFPPPHHIESCRRFVERGAHVVLGHHPHQPQGVEVYRGGVIAYSLGNFLFDMGDVVPPSTREIMVLRFDVTKDGISGAQIVPYIMGGDQTIRTLNGSERDEALQHYRHLSEALSEPRNIQHEWYCTIRRYLLIHLKSLWHNTVRMRKILFPVSFFRQFLKSQPNRRMLMGFAKFLINGHGFGTEFSKLRLKLQRRRVW